jgi:hypothetical protein
MAREAAGIREKTSRLGEHGLAGEKRRDGLGSRQPTTKFSHFFFHHSSDMAFYTHS